MTGDPTADRLRHLVAAAIAPMVVRVDAELASLAPPFDEQRLRAIGEAIRASCVAVGTILTPPEFSTEISSDEDEKVAYARAERSLHKPVIGRLASCAMAIDFRLALPHSADDVEETIHLVLEQLALIRSALA